MVGVNFYVQILTSNHKFKTFYHDMIHNDWKNLCGSCKIPFRISSSKWLFQCVQFCMDLFAKGEDGGALHLKAMTISTLIPKQWRKLEFLSWIMFQLISYGVRVTRPFIWTTMDFACGKILMSPIDVSINMWTTYFEVYKSCTWSSIAPMWLEEEEAQRNALCSIEVQDCPNIALGLLNLPTFGPQLLEEVKNVRKRLIFKSLFSYCLLAGKAL